MSAARLLAFIEKHPPRTSITLDACIPLSVILNEPEKKIIQGLLERLRENKPRLYVLVKLQSVSVEIHRVAHHKMREVFKLALGCVDSIIEDLERGIRLVDAVKKERNALIANPQYKNFYNYLEKRGFGLQSLVETPSRKEELIKRLLHFSDLIYEECEALTTEFHVIRDKDDLVTWIRNKENDAIWKEFRKRTSGIGKSDRRHLLGCIRYSEERNKKISFVTKDKLLIQKSNEALEGKWDDWVLVCNSQDVIETDEILRQRITIQ